MLTRLQHLLLVSVAFQNDYTYRRGQILSISSTAVAIVHDAPLPL